MKLRVEIDDLTGLFHGDAQTCVEIDNILLVTKRKNVCLFVCERIRFVLDSC